MFIMNIIAVLQNVWSFTDNVPWEKDCTVRPVLVHMSQLLRCKVDRNSIQPLGASLNFFLIYLPTSQRPDGEPQEEGSGM